jgi:protoporphyrinogen oxidase
MKMEPREHWCVAGAGMLGLALALRLADEGRRVTVIEAAPDTGGLAAADRIDGITWDRFYHVILPGDRRVLDLLARIGLSGAVEWARTRTGFFARGRMSPLDGAVDYMRLPVLGPVAKARLAFTLMMAARIRDGRPLERRPVADWLTAWSGRQAFDRLWRPLLRAKLGANADRASAAFIWATIRRLYLARSAGAKTERLGFVDGGYARILGAMRAELAARGVEVVTGCPITRIAQDRAGMVVETAQGVRRFDHVAATLPAAATARLCEGLSPDIRARLEAVVYQGIICATAVLDRPLGGFYLTYLTDEDLPFTAIVEMSALTGTARFGGRTLVYLPRYMTQEDPWWSLSDDEIEARFRDGLVRVYPDLDPQAIRAMRIARVRHVMAVPTIGYSDVVPPVETNLPGLHLVTSAQITDGTLNVDATLGVIDRAMPALLAARAGERLGSAA